MSDAVDQRVKVMAERHLAAAPNSRASKALRAMLDKGSVTTDDLKNLGYNHAPRAIGDVRDAGIPVVTERARTADGRPMARYRLGRAENIQDDRHAGRSVLPKSFKIELLAKYSSSDCITGARLDSRVLQIDHRIPYRVAGDAGLAERDTSAYMLLDASSQRAKSWSCEHCANFLNLRDPDVCKSCFWAYPESYQHIAMQEIRRTDIIWKEDDVSVHDRLKAQADQDGTSMSELMLRLARSKAWHND